MSLTSTPSEKIFDLASAIMDLSPAINFSKNSGDAYDGKQPGFDGSG
jgi:hypothetical protein